MKITHLALNSKVTDHLTYQENLLPKYHKKMGLDVSIITSQYIWDKGKVAIDKRSVYFNEYDIEVIRLQNKLSTTINSKFKMYKNLYDAIDNEAPDIIFVHSLQFLDIKVLIRYLKKNPQIEVYVDNHADFSNSATSWISKNILHKIVWKSIAKMIEPYTTKFYGVLPARVNFLKKMYGISEEKIELLELGADDEKVDKFSKPVIQKEVRDYFNIKENDFFIVTGGKIDESKRQVINLMNTVVGLEDLKVKLVVFGSVIPDMKDQVQTLAKNKSIEYIGWINNEQSYKLFAAADLVIFPGRHSVYWEQVVAIGTPLVTKYWEGTTHIDINGNCIFLYEDTEKELSEVLNKIIYNENVYQNLFKNAQKQEKDRFLYSEIAKKSLRESFFEEVECSN